MTTDPTPTPTAPASSPSERLVSAARAVVAEYRYSSKSGRREYFAAPISEDVMYELVQAVAALAQPQPPAAASADGLRAGVEGLAAQFELWAKDSSSHPQWAACRGDCARELRTLLATPAPQAQAEAGALPDSDMRMDVFTGVTWAPERRTARATHLPTGWTVEVHRGRGDMRNGEWARRLLTLLVIDADAQAQGGEVGG